MNAKQRCQEPDNYEDLIYLFNGLFQPSTATQLIAGHDEPEYRPADGQCRWNRILFAHEFYASALHEVSHWCIAGAARRRLVDYGYWYQPDGRTVDEQALFERVESRPQALEWIFAAAVGRRFHLSLDNLDGPGAGQRARFASEVQRHAQRYIQRGLPQRAALFRDALLDWYGRRTVFEQCTFSRHQLG